MVVAAFPTSVAVGDPQVVETTERVVGRELGTSLE